VRLEGGVDGGMSQPWCCQGGGDDGLDLAPPPKNVGRQTHWYNDREIVSQTCTLTLPNRLKFVLFHVTSIRTSSHNHFDNGHEYSAVRNCSVL
jgi:hypothetical protein